MPGGDRTGPAGMGPMTGRAAGYCAGNAAPGFASAGAGGRFGGGGGRGRGGRGRRNRFYATGLTGWQRAAGGQSALRGAQPAPPVRPSEGRQAQVETFQQQVSDLSRQLGEVNQRLAELARQGETDEKQSPP